MNPGELIRAELAGLGMPDAGVEGLMRHTVARFLAHLAQQHNGLPGEDLVAAVPDGHRPAAGVITMALVQLARTGSHGVCNPDVGLPQRYAAELVLTATRTAAEAA